MSTQPTDRAESIVLVTETTPALDRKEASAMNQVWTQAFKHFSALLEVEDRPKQNLFETVYS